MEHKADISLDFIERISGPARIDIGAGTEDEIVLTIMAEILAIIRKRTPDFLKNKNGSIYSL
ncbi:hypothetical protein [Eudoraea chungangensis]|uniref:hypothetical protein n=1 Tax=Eudoraea chungangensis TaxID=1481905 RepID=UPI0023EBE917|nr:hypothetical protein [Eudoraea chungangensis]